MPILSERAVTRVIKIPPASSSGPLADTWPLDAGSVIILRSNSAHVEREAVRQLCVSMGPGEITGFETAADVTADLRASGSPSPFSAETWQEIPWDRRTAIRLGPVHVIADREMDDGLPTLRTIKILADFNIPTGYSSPKYYFAATLDPSPFRLNGLGSLPGLVGSTAFGGTGQQQVTGTLTCTAPIRVQSHPDSRQWTCRPVGDDAALSVAVIPLYVWIGWRLVSSSPPTVPAAYLNGVSVWETR